MKNNIPIARTSLTEKEIQSVLEPLQSGWLVQGPKVDLFEKSWSNFTGSKNSLAVTSCTSGMHLALAALKLEPMDEVIVPAFTWISTANVIEHHGAKPVFCDIDLKTFNIDISLIEDLISERTVGILPVHLFGLPCDINPIIEIAQKYNLWVVEDAACGFGSKYQGKHVGNFGQAGVFSFHPRKAITTGEGGMVTTNNQELATNIQQLRDHGAVISDRQRHLGPKPYLLSDHIHAGYNQRMTDIQGALGLSQMDRAHEIVTERRSVASIFTNCFSNIDWLQVPCEPEGYEHGYQSYPCLLVNSKKNQLSNLETINTVRNKWMEDLQSLGVSTRPATHAVHMLTYYAKKYNIKPYDYPNAYYANECSISLPLFHGMTESEINHVVDVVKKSNLNFG